MKKRCAGMAVVLALLVAFGIGTALDFHGVINPNGDDARDVRIDSVLVIPPDTMFLTAGWRAQGTTYDTFDFPDPSQWPMELWVYGVINVFSTTVHIIGLVGQQWYPLCLGVHIPLVMFYDTAGIYAVAESKPAVETRPRLVVSPSVVTGQMTVRLQPAGMGRPVVEIHDAVGNVVRALDCSVVAGGLATATWNREDDRGRLVPDGVYFCRYAEAGVIAVRKVLVAH